ncbi:probable G-protein coupled receptor 139 [Stegostoma tigrinum]|uniref:probable G-protein coupled receptor 139 n=1 Tax=Stegostoma tigrinum TaxID=3053191 RepID=UPI00287043A8|nr:probable G-protein coupled receptor 139 [Stegostoma tigrinum]
MAARFVCWKWEELQEKFLRELFTACYPRVSAGASPLTRTGIRSSKEGETGDRNLRTRDWNVLTMDQNVRTIGWNVVTMDRDLSWSLFILSLVPLSAYWIENLIYVIQHFYYPILAIVGVPGNVMTIFILLCRNCGLSKCITHYLLAMAIADLTVIILDLILRHIPIVYSVYSLMSLPVCNIHAVLLYAATDCSVWFTVTFTFDRFVAICYPHLKSRYCRERMVAVFLGAVTAISCFKNIFWYFMFWGYYRRYNAPWFCLVTSAAQWSLVYGAIEFLHNILNPCVPFVLILLLNLFTVRHILVTSRARRRVRAHSSTENPRDQEMESRRKSMILLFLLSANFILLWSLFLFYSVWWRMYSLGFVPLYLYSFVQELGFMLQLLSCCTNTAIYAVTQTRFRKQLKNVLSYPFTHIYLLIKYIY